MGFIKHSNVESIKIIDPDDLDDKEKLELKKTFDFSCDEEEPKDSKEDSEKSN